MANLYITEFRRLAEDGRGRTIPVGELPPVTGQRVVFTTTTLSVVLAKATRFVRVIADADAFLAVGGAGTVATALSSLKIEADVAEYFGVDGTKELQIAAYDGSS